MNETDDWMSDEPFDLDDDTLDWDLGGRLSLPDDFAAPPVRLAPATELETAAWAAPALTRLAAFVDWVGKGRNLDDDLELAPAQVTELIPVLGVVEPEPSGDAGLDRAVAESEVQLTWDLADRSDFVDIEGALLVRTPAGREIDSDPLAAWQAAFESRLELGVIDLDDNGPPWGQAMDDAIADLVVLAHLRDDPVPVAELVEMLWEQSADDLLEGAGDDPDLREGLRHAMADDVGRLVDTLADLGVITVADGACSITPLGSWAAVQLMRDDGHDAPVIGELADEDAASLLVACGEMDPPDAAAELSAWLEARPAGDAVAQLAEAARAGGSASSRSMFYFAIDQLGTDAADAVRTLQGDQVLRPYATAWLISRDLEHPSVLAATDVPVLMADQLAAALAGGGPDGLVEVLAALGPPREQVEAIEAIWRVEMPAVDDVLAAIGTHHDAKIVAKAARKAEFKRKSAGLT